MPLDNDFVPPVGDIPDSSFGQYVPDGNYLMRVIGHTLHSNDENVWLRTLIMDGPHQNTSEYSMNVFLPTKEALNRKMQEKGGDRDKALQAFFHYAQTYKRLGLTDGLSIPAALDAMTGKEFEGYIATGTWQGKRQTKLVEIIGPKKASAPAPAAPDTTEGGVGF